MTWLPWVIALLATVEAGWMLFDGTRAFVVGDYVTPKTGPHAGQLGPWTHLVRAVGIEPRSTLMKAIFVSYGAGWLVLVVCFLVLGTPWTWWAMFAAGRVAVVLADWDGLRCRADGVVACDALVEVVFVVAPMSPEGAG